MNTAFNNIHPGMTLEDALKILETSVEKLHLDSDYYMAVAHLLNFPGVATEEVLLNIARNESSSQAIRLARRKAIEVLARLECVDAILIMKDCLASKDQYLVENAAWGLQQLRCQDTVIHQIMVDLLSNKSQNKRVIIQSLASLGVTDALSPIESLLNDEQPSVRSAACSAVIQLSGKRVLLPELEKYLVSSNPMNRQLVIQDIIDCRGFEILPSVLSAPVSPVFRLRAISAMCQDIRDRSRDKQLVIWLDRLLEDNPNYIDLVHRYDSVPCSQFLLEELFQPDFSRCYLALLNLSLHKSDTLWPLIISSWHDRFNIDYGAHYFLMQLFRLVKNWPLEHINTIEEILLSSILDRRPQFAKSRPSSILALSQISPSRSLPLIREWCSEREMADWQCRYAALMVLSNHIHDDNISKVVYHCMADRHIFIKIRAKAALRKTLPPIQ